jgi:ABC-type lipoprotein release transport system permease subunit
MGALRIAWRNTGRNLRRTAIVVGAVLVGISGTVLTMGLDNGLVFQMVETAISTDLGHIQVHAAGFAEDPDLAHSLDDGGAAAATALRELPDVEAWSRRVRGEGLVYSPRASAGVRVVGIEPAQEARVSVVAGSIREGSYLGGERRRVLLGAALAERLEVGVGDKIVLSAQDVSGELTGEAFRVGGLYRTASRDFDAGTLFLPLADAQRLFGLGDAVSEVVVIAKRREAVAELRDALRARLGPGAEVRSWDELQPLLVYMIDLMDQSAWIVYAAVFVAMAFGIANVLLMAVYERMRELGVLAAIGMRPRRVVLMIVAESVFLTGLGLVLGFAAAGAGVAALGDGLDLSFFAEGLEAYGIGSRIAPVVRPYDLLVPSAVALLTAVAASLWPALHAVRLRPAETLRRT